ncbi:DUF4190 domain-containing protein [Curtobacterium sp. MCBD17_008]|uniref:DUF4190 domain-containing protein n=1 Tax=Curtobacterium sp. MCBD17_008 TaxID=2175656 RepID=UPI000DA760A8|nr:DUF4190 domain-containing protein [Curtobacterium sp. MCBD17_008]PZE92898.1 hypothetical protein DEI95_08035 [Curtobacterium sp. MCBD17_008]
MTSTPSKPYYSTYAIVGFVLAFVLPIAGAIVSTIGIRDTRKNNLRGHKLAIAGLLIGIIVAVTFIGTGASGVFN